MFLAQRLVGPSKQLKQIIQIEHNIVKNPIWPEANQFANSRLPWSGQSGTQTKDLWMTLWIASPTRWPLGHAVS